MRICMVCDFFFPNAGGVESHIYQLSQCLLARGHDVIVITHVYDDRVGVRHMPKNLKVYYLPFPPFYNQCIFPCLLATLPMIRQILIRERVDLVHGHSAFSTLGHDSILHASSLGLPCVFTDHSLFGFADLSSVLTNKLLQIILTRCQAVVCVSHTSKENTVLRATLPPEKVFVIPNAIDPMQFRPFKPVVVDPPDRIRVVVISRLVYRKGMDLLAGVLPMVCDRFPCVDFIIGGDGPKWLSLHEVRDAHRLFDRVTFLGALKHADVASVLNRGHIFLNTSLTEAFCIAIVEAASCGLTVVSTRVGGIPEVLPPSLNVNDDGATTSPRSRCVFLAEPNVDDVLDKLSSAVQQKLDGNAPDPETVHQKLKDIYTWPRIAERTEVVYNCVMKSFSHSVRPSLVPLTSRRVLINQAWTTAGFFGLFLIVFHAIWGLFLDWFSPRDRIEITPEARTTKLRYREKIS